MENLAKDNYGYLEKKVDFNKNYYRINKVAGIAICVVRALFLIGMAYILLYPLLNMLSMAFRPAVDIADSTVKWIPRKLTMSNVNTAINALSYWSALGDTSIMALGSTLLQLITCSLVGYGFARYNFRGKNILFMLVLFTLIVPPQTISISSFVSFRFFDFFGISKLFGYNVNLLNSPWPFFIQSAFGVGLRSGLFIYIFRQFFRGMPKDLENAAKIDGCGPLKVFISVIVPNAGSSYLTVFLFSLVWHWNDYTMSSLFYQTKHRPLAVLVSSLQGTLAALGQRDSSAINGVLNAGALLFVLPLLILYIFAQRYFIESVSSTGIKG